MRNSKFLNTLQKWECTSKQKNNAQRMTAQVAFICTINAIAQKKTSTEPTKLVGYAASVASDVTNLEEDDSEEDAIKKLEEEAEEEGKNEGSALLRTLHKGADQGSSFVKVTLVLSHCVNSLCR